jgi:hypothetical protein
MNFLWNESIYQRYHAHRHRPPGPHPFDSSKSRRFTSEQRRAAAIAKLPDSIVAEYLTAGIKELCRKHHCSDVVMRAALVSKGARIRTRAEQRHRPGIENMRRAA